jgi:hypothetical protein
LGSAAASLFGQQLRRHVDHILHVFVSAPHLGRLLQHLRRLAARAAQVWELQQLVWQPQTSCGTTSNAARHENEACGAR